MCERCVNRILKTFKSRLIIHQIIYLGKGWMASIRKAGYKSENRIKGFGRLWLLASESSYLNLL